MPILCFDHSSWNGQEILESGIIIKEGPCNIMPAYMKTNDCDFLKMIVEQLILELKMKISKG